MPQTIRVHLAPTLVTPDELAGRTVLMIDLLRASTTICYALAAGATDVMPFVEVEEVRSTAETARSRGEPVVCGGERGGQRIEGFDLGNSPREYVPELLAGKRVLFTTTNGTRALNQARSAKQVLIACLANLSLTVDLVKEAPGVDILCAGSGGSITREDVIAAGAYVARLMETSPVSVDDSALVALDAWQAASGGIDRNTPAGTERVARSLAEGKHGRHLISLGYAEDLKLCAAVDSLDLAAEFDARSGVVRARRRDE